MFRFFKHYFLSTERVVEVAKEKNNEEKEKKEGKELVLGKKQKSCSICKITAFTNNDFDFVAIKAVCQNHRGKERVCRFCFESVILKHIESKAFKPVNRFTSEYSGSGGGMLVTCPFCTEGYLNWQITLALLSAFGRSKAMDVSFHVYDSMLQGLVACPIQGCYEFSRPQRNVIRCVTHGKQCIACMRSILKGRKHICKETSLKVEEKRWNDWGEKEDDEKGEFDFINWITRDEEEMPDE